MCAASPSARRKDLGDDLISQLLTAESGGGRLSEDELVATVVLLLNAGHEATVHGLGNGVKTMLEQQVARAGVAAKRTRRLEELLRFDPPLHLFTRYALQDVEFAGVAFAQGRQDRPSARRRQSRS